MDSPTVMMSAFHPEEYVIASSIEEATSLLDRHADHARIIAGGTGIHELAHHGLLPDVNLLIDITELDLGQVEFGQDDIRIGATTTFTDLLDAAASEPSPELAVLVDALRAIRPMQVRNVATVGGSLCSSLPFFDLPPALLALSAEVLVAGSADTRLVPIEDFFLDYFAPDVRPNEIVTEIVVPRPGAGRSGAFRKLETNSVDWALASVAVCLGRDDGRLKDVRVALGGAVGRKVVRARTVEQALEGETASEERLRRAAELVSRDVSPHGDFRASAEYRLEICKVYIRRCIETALARAGG
jgi:aerobic carbon-monoxide dehydrogenase medium subunit